MTATELTIGAAAPDLSLPDERGGTWRLAEALTRSTQVLVFYRGDW
ncbi:MAG: redoxin domain-containing protein [Chloroflexi bacterium]|nr:redoxin domain-containing protein [Chloroflexota bacterium]